MRGKRERRAGSHAGEHARQNYFVNRRVGHQKYRTSRAPERTARTWTDSNEPPLMISLLGGRPFTPIAAPKPNPNKGGGGKGVRTN